MTTGFTLAAGVGLLMASIAVLGLLLCVVAGWTGRWGMWVTGFLTVCAALFVALLRQPGVIR